MAAKKIRLGKEKKFLTPPPFGSTKVPDERRNQRNAEDPGDEVAIIRQENLDSA